MLRVLFQIPLGHGQHLSIHSYGVMLVLGFLIALFIAKRRAKRDGLDPNSMVDLALVALCSGVIGARLFYVLQFRDEFAGPGGLLKAIKIWEGGLVFYGGFILAALAVILFVRAKGLPFIRTLDAIAPASMLGLVFGRIGCFLNGCCYGKPTDLPWGVVFPFNGYHPCGGTDVAFAYTQGSGIVPGTPVHPTELYEALAALTIFIVLDVYSDHKKRKGTVTLLFLTLYPIWRFFVEFLRADTAVPHGLTASQMVSLGVFVVALVFWALHFAYPDRPEPEISRSERRAAERHKPKDDDLSQ